MAVRGRHRRHQPSRLNRASLTAVGSAGIALPLIGAGTAHAASVDVWEKVAACESTNRWQVNTGNGYYGGLQFSQSTWQAYGGTRYAPRADLATKDQQIAIAEKVLKGQGPRAWPTCSQRAGLARGGEKPDVTPDGRADRRDRPAATPTTIPNQRRESYTVARGDTLSRIAAEKRVQGGWQRLYAQNRAVIGGDPDLIMPGQRLALRGAPGGTQTEPSARSGSKPRTPDAKAAAPSTKPKAPTAGPTVKAPDKAAPSARPKSRPRPQSTAQKPAPRPVAQKPKAKPRPQAVAKPVVAKSRTGTLSSPVDASPGTAYGKPGSAWSSGYHTGVDFPVPTGTSVRAVATGRVVSAGWAGAYGYQVVIRHDDGKYSQYAHLSALSVREGQTVGSGQRIARSGSTGNSSGPHLHFEVRTGPGYGSDVDPLAYLRRGGVSL
ncbi:transglycosylase family protein [Streptomyces kanasensis]|uniref:transglycosylase family protein n=1 Tax=Streptomyces kanasensis TaxID=936756 RepID=UPI0036F4C347